MPYTIAGETFPTKAAVTERCRQILKATPDGALVQDGAAFLADLFAYHWEWDEKVGAGLRGFSPATTEHGTRCFMLVRTDGTKVDISFPHAIRCLPSGRDMMPQELRNFRNAARQCIRDQVLDFKAANLCAGMLCPIEGTTLTWETCQVDHIYPDTFDALVHRFCETNNIDPMQVEALSKNGVVPVFADESIDVGWRAFHAKEAKLRLLSASANAKQPKVDVDWAALGPRAAA